MYSENTKAVLALYSLFIIVIICVVASECFASDKVELALPKKVILVEPHPCACYHIIEAANGSDWLGVAGSELNLVEVCNNKYDITTMIVWNQWREVYDVEVVSAPLCPMFRWDTHYYIDSIPKYWEYSVWAE